MPREGAGLGQLHRETTPELPRAHRPVLFPRGWARLQTSWLIPFFFFLPLRLTPEFPNRARDRGVKRYVDTPHRAGREGGLQPLSGSRVHHSFHSSPSSLLPSEQRENQGQSRPEAAAPTPWSLPGSP